MREGPMSEMTETRRGAAQSMRDRMGETTVPAAAMDEAMAARLVESFPGVAEHQSLARTVLGRLARQLATSMGLAEPIDHGRGRW